MRNHKASKLAAGWGRKGLLECDAVFLGQQRRDVAGGEVGVCPSRLQGSISCFRSENSKVLSFSWERSFVVSGGQLLPF